MAYLKHSVAGKMQSSLEALRKEGALGDWWVNTEKGEVWIMMPYDFDGEVCGAVVCWPYGYALGNGSQWRFSGTPENPTLQPSLNWENTWHGYFKNGRLESV